HREDRARRERLPPCASGRPCERRGPGVTATSRSERFLVTGALGCIAEWTVRELRRECVPVVCYALGTNHRRLDQIMTADELANVTLVAGDITDLDALDRTLAEHD